MPLYPTLSLPLFFSRYLLPFLHCLVGLFPPADKEELYLLPYLDDSQTWLPVRVTGEPWNIQSLEAFPNQWNQNLWGWIKASACLKLRDDFHAQPSLRITALHGLITLLMQLPLYVFYQFSSVTQSCPTLCDPMNHSMPGLPVHHQLPEFTQTHVHWVGDAIQPSPSPPAPNPSQNQGLFQWVSSSHEVVKVLEFQL